MELGDLKGVGRKTEEQLNEAGINSLNDLAKASVDDLTSLGGFSESKAEKLIGRAKENALIVQTGDEVVNEYDSKNKIPSGIEPLDSAIGGGFQQGHIVGLSGGSNTGKTQLCFQTMVNAVEETGNPAVYIETEPHRYEPERLRSLASSTATQENIFRIKAYDLEKQVSAYKRTMRIPEQLDDVDDISVVCVDSFNSAFRLSDKFDGRGSLSERSTEFGKHLRTLVDMVETLDVPSLLTLQVYGNPSAYGSSVRTYGGELVNHTLTYMVKMSDAEANMKQAKIQGHTGRGEQEVYLSIQDSSITGYEDI